MNNDSQFEPPSHSCGRDERSAATLRQTDGTTRKPTQQKQITTYNTKITIKLREIVILSKLFSFTKINISKSLQIVQKPS